MLLAGSLEYVVQVQAPQWPHYIPSQRRGRLTLAGVLVKRDKLGLATEHTSFQLCRLGQANCVGLVISHLVNGLFLDRPLADENLCMAHFVHNPIAKPNS